MLLSLALLFILGIGLSQVCHWLKLPNLVGYIFTGLILGPEILAWLDSGLLDLSANLRQLALVIILIRAGLTLDLRSLAQVKYQAIKLAFLPATFEILGYFLLGPKILGLSTLNSAILGSIMAAVSPAVVVPRMINLKLKGYGEDKSIAEIVLAAASIDDIYVIVIFTSLLSLRGTGSFSPLVLLNIPTAIISGAVLGTATALIFYYLIGDSLEKIPPAYGLILILGLGILIYAGEDYIVKLLPFSGLIGVLALASVLSIKLKSSVKEVNKSFGSLWTAFELLLFGLIGAQLKLGAALDEGLSALAIVGLGLAFRSLGVALASLGNHYNSKEKTFLIFSYLPKATVQAAIGGIPLALGLAGGETILTVAVLGILITAPLGAYLIDRSYPKLLKKKVQAKSNHQLNLD